MISLISWAWKFLFISFCFIFLCLFYFSVLCMDRPQEITKPVSNTLNNYDTTIKYKNFNKIVNIPGVHTVIEIKQTLMYWFITQKERTVRKNWLLMDILHIDNREMNGLYKKEYRSMNWWKITDIKTKIYNLTKLPFTMYQ